MTLFLVVQATFWLGIALCLRSELRTYKELQPCILYPTRLISIHVRRANYVLVDYNWTCSLRGLVFEPLSPVASCAYIKKVYFTHALCHIK